MSRILFCAWPLVGHLHPLIEIGRELSRRGNSVAFYCAERMRGTLEGEGFRVFPFASIDGEFLDHILLSRERSVRWSQPLRLMRLYRQWCLDTIPGQTKDVEQILDDWQPDAILADEAMWALHLVLRDKQRVPVIAVSPLAGCLVPGMDAPLHGFGLGPARTLPARMLHKAIRQITALLASGIRKRLNQIRQQQGLSRIRRPVRMEIGRAPLYLVRGTPEFDYLRRDLPSTVKYIGALAWQGEASDPSASDACPSQGAALRPLVFVSEGTMQSREPVLLRAAAKGLAGLDADVVLATGTHRDPELLSLGPLASNIQVVQWVSQKLLFARASLVVTVGGCGTVFGALSAGVPLIVVPAESDQPDNARRVLHTRTGLRLARNRCTAESLRSTVMQALADPSLRRNAQGMARIFAAYRGASHAANLVEQFLATQDNPNETQKRQSSQAVLPETAALS